MALTYQLVTDGTTNGTLGTIGLNTGLVHFIPDLNHSGPAGFFTYQVDNGYGLSNIAQVNVNVSAVNDPPNITSNAPTGTYFVGDAYSYTPITATDPDNAVSTLVWSATGLPAWLTLTQTAGVASLSGTVAAGTVTFNLIVTDPGGLTDTQEVVVGGIVPDVNSYFKFWFDSSGSMNSTKARLNRDLLGTGVTDPYVDATCLQFYLQDFYATGLTKANGNSDSATNGETDYGLKVSIIDNPNEDPFQQLNNNSTSSTSGFSTAAGGDFPSASSVVIGLFMDEASNIGVSSSPTNTWAATATTTTPITAAAMTSVTNLRTQITTLNASNTAFYRGLTFWTEVNNQPAGTDSNLLSAWNSAVTNDSATQFGANGLSSIATYLTPTGGANIEDGSTTNGYYTQKVIVALQGLGYSLPAYSG